MTSDVKSTSVALVYYSKPMSPQKAIYGLPRDPRERESSIDQERQSVQ